MKACGPTVQGVEEECPQTERGNGGERFVVLLGVACGRLASQAKGSEDCVACGTRSELAAGRPGTGGSSPVCIWTKQFQELNATASMSPETKKQTITTRLTDIEVSMPMQVEGEGGGKTYCRQ